VLRLAIAGVDQRSSIADFRLFSGTLSPYHLGRIAARQAPSTLLERELPLAAWVEGGTVMLGPVRALELGTYTVATPELGRVVEFVVTETVPVLARLWPPRSVLEGVGPLVYCGEVAGVPVGEFTLAPAAVAAALAAGVDASGSFADRCVQLAVAEPPPGGTLLLPPILESDVALDPAPLRYVSRERTEPPCIEAELALGPLCAEVQDDRLVIRAFGAPALLSLTAPTPWLSVVLPGQSAVLRGLAPDSEYALSGGVSHSGAGQERVQLTFTTLPRRPHLVIDEVLLDPAGVERVSEWIELTNDGSAALSLAGMSIEDVGGVAALPPVSVASGERVLLVDDEFGPDLELDLAPPPTARLVRVTELGKGGLSNQGELLRLRDSAGIVISRFPANKSKRPGQSVARRTSDAPDDEPTSFAPHADPGASPGAPNML
jgi:hypothetical protein